MDINALVLKIIPPADYQHRNGFNNIPYLKELNYEEKKQLEDALINILSSQSERYRDTLIIETLAYIKSNKSVPLLDVFLNESSNSLTKLTIAASIFRITEDDRLIKVAIECLNAIENNPSYYSETLTSAFYELIRFKNPEINKIIESYTTHKDYIIVYNAKRALVLGQGDMDDL